MLELCRGRRSGAGRSSARDNPYVKENDYGLVGMACGSGGGLVLLFLLRYDSLVG